MYRKHIFHGFFTCSNDLKIVFFWGSKLYAHETFFLFRFPVIAQLKLLLLLEVFDPVYYAINN